jgi:putative RNA 2'-phosphotransferase
MGAHTPSGTLAKTLRYIAWVAPAVHGLFWDGDGTMPWKELYWVLQEDPELRFVRESHVRELLLLGIALPFTLEGSRLKLLPSTRGPDYPLATEVPERLYWAYRPRQHHNMQQHGLRAAARPWLPLAMDRELALRIGKRRHPEAVIVDILARRAAANGTPFHCAGEGLFLASAIAPEYLILPLLRQDLAARPPARGAGVKSRRVAAERSHPGSYLVSAETLQTVTDPQGAAKTRHKSGRGSDWKRRSRRERTKRTV